ncbi:hypothetical protein ACLQ2R_36680 [Streptosporangium sp. DT93]|uniref:hypothetical protein n=1 Tax=Streptosporangium sp. DT93 TaxID=3393428 RepID=UPI003CF3F567
MCARSGCANRLESPGRAGRRSGRPALYCGDACRAAAHRARTPAVTDALRRAGALSGDLLSAGEQWSAHLAAFTEALNAAR